METERFPIMAATMGQRSGCKDGSSNFTGKIVLPLPLTWVTIIAGFDWSSSKYVVVITSS